MVIRLKKKTDGSAALSCIRDDGSVTWQQQNGAQGAFFPLHDITHYAVETVLGHRKGFYGLVAAGWDITDFAAPWPKGRLPDDMDPSELLVGFLDVERASGVYATAADFNDKARIYYQEHAQPASGDRVQVTDRQLEQIREVRDALFMKWHAVPAGDALELTF